MADLETEFFIALAWGSWPLLSSAALGGLYSGLGLTRHILWVSGAGSEAGSQAFIIMETIRSRTTGGVK